MKLHRGILSLGLASLFSDMAAEMVYPLLPIFFTGTLGAGVLFLGLFEGVAEGVASVTKYFAGAASDRAPRREPFVFWGYIVANGVRPLIGLVTAPWQALFLRAADRVGKGIRTSPRDAWLAQMTTPGDRGMVFGFHRAMDHAGATLGPLVATLFLLYFPGSYRALFLWTLVPGLAAAFFILVAAKAFPSRRDPSPLVKTGFSWVSPPLRYFLGVTGFFTLAMASDAFLLLNLSRVGVPTAWIPALWAGLHVVKASSSWWGGKLSDHWGRRETILAGWVLYTLFYGAFAFLDHRGWVTGLFLAYGVFYGMTEGPEKALLADLAPPDRRGEAFGLYHLIVGVGSLPASFLFGALWQFQGSAAAFGVVAAISAISCVFLARWPGAKKDNISFDAGAMDRL